MANLAKRVEGIPESVRMPDNAQYINRFQVQSESSDRLYTIAQHRTGRWWACSCRGWIAHKHCKHLRSLGLPGCHQPAEPKRISYQG